MELQAYIIFSDENPKLPLQDRVMEVLLNKSEVDSIVRNSNGILWSKAITIKV